MWQTNILPGRYKYPHQLARKKCVLAFVLPPHRFPFLPGNRAGCQEDNLFDYNLAALVHIIDRLSDYDNGGGQGNAKSLTCLRQSHSNHNNVEEREIAQQFLECNAKYCIFFEISSYSEYLWIGNWNYDLQMSQDTMRRRPSANPAQPHCADGCHGRGLLLHQRQESASTSGKLGCFVRSTSPKVWQILWISEPGKLHAGILKATCRPYFLKGWYHEVHFAAVLDIFGRFIFQPFSDISCKCIRITQPLSISFNIRSCWIHAKVDWQFRFWWLFGISFPNCAACFGG